MKKVIIKFFTAVLLLLLLLTTGASNAQKPARMGPAPDKEISEKRKLLDADMNNPDAHKEYIYAMGLINPRLLTQYRAWVAKYPQNITIPLAIGTAYFNAEMPEAREFLLKAAIMHPQDASLWSMLANDADRLGKTELTRAYLRRALLADSSNLNYATTYLMLSKDIEPNYPERVFDFTKRFPEDEHGAMVLYWLAADAVGQSEKIRYLEALRSQYSPSKYNWSAAGMTDLADLYLQTDPERALVLSIEMGAKQSWALRKEAAAALLRINQLEADHSYKEAVEMLNHLQLPKYNIVEDYLILKKAGLLAKENKFDAAYDTVLVRYAKLPTDPLHNALELYRLRIGKERYQLEQDIKTLRQSTLAPAYPFKLKRYTDSSMLSLEDLKGKIILLTFWFPGCGPCRAEFPHFQSVINKFDHKDIVYLAVSVLPEQDPYVIPFLKNTKYSFIPLRGTESFAATHYGVRGEPKNFLIDRNGNIAFKDFFIDSSNSATLELMIASLLNE